MPIPGIGVELTGQSVVLFGIGFLLAGLFAVVFLPAVHNRAVRLTTTRIEAGLPISMKEIQADKDRLRADFAVSARQLEIGIEELRNKTLAQKADLGEKTALIKRLRTELDERFARILALEARESELEAREKSLFDQLRTSKAETVRMADALYAAELAAAEARAEQREFGKVYEERARLVESQRLEILALQAQIDSIRRRVYEMASCIKADETRPARLWVEREDVVAARGNGNGAFDMGAYGNGGIRKNGGNGGEPAAAPVTSLRDFSGHS